MSYTFQHDTPIADLVPGNVIYAKLALDPRDIARLSTKSAKDVLAGRQIPRFCIVLEPPTNGEVKVAYTATFSGAVKIADLKLMDKLLWCPIAPAPNEFSIEPLPVREGPAATIFQWISLRQAHAIKQSTFILATDFCFTAEEAEKIRGWIKDPSSAVVQT